MLLNADVRECNRSEVIFLPPAAVSPSVEFGATVDAACCSADRDVVSLAQLHGVYAAERYMLAWRDGRGYVLLRSNHTGRDLLKVRHADSRSLRPIEVFATGAAGHRYNLVTNELGKRCRACSLVQYDGLFKQGRGHAHAHVGTLAGGVA